MGLPAADPSPAQALLLRRPILAIVFFCITGAVSGFVFYQHAASGLVCTAVLLAAWLLCRHKPWSLVFLYGAILTAFMANAALRVGDYSDRELVALMEKPSEFVTLVGTVGRDPVLHEAQDGSMTWAFPLHVEAVNRMGSQERAFGTVRILLRQGYGVGDVTYGDRWLLPGTLKAQPETERIRTGAHRYVMVAMSKRAERLSQGNGNAFVAFCLRGRRASAAILSRGLEDYPDQAGVMKALLLGYKHELSDDLQRAFSSTGTLHIFAISGLHVGVMALLFTVLLRATGVSKRYWVLLLGPLLIAYTIGTGMKTSAVRACVMAIVYGSAFLFSRKPDGLSSLGLAAVLILAAAPTQLADPGFIFSFTIVAMLILLCPRVAPLFEGFSQRAFHKDPWSIEAEPKWKRACNVVGLFVIGLVITSMVAWLASAPLTARYFNLLSPVALVGNVLVIPSAFLVVLTGCLSLCVGWVSGFMAEVFNHANRAFISALIGFMQGMADVPAGHFAVKSPPWMIVGTWYVLLVAFAYTRAPTRKVVVFASVTGLAVCTWMMAINRPAEVHAVSTGHGQAVLVDVPGRGDILIDPGPAFSAQRLLTYLRKQGVNRLDAVIVTELDPRKTGALEAIAEELAIDEFWYSARSPVEDSATLEMMQGEGIEVRQLVRGDRGEWGGRLAWEVLHPSEEGRYLSTRTAAPAIRIACEASSIIYVGQPTERLERDMLQAPLEIGGSILVLGRVGGREACSDRWLNEVSPDLAIFASDWGTGAGFIERLEAHDIAWHRTDEMGPVVIRMDGKSLTGRSE